jgi:hypothetical protein
LRLASSHADQLERWYPLSRGSRLPGRRREMPMYDRVALVRGVGRGLTLGRWAAGLRDGPFALAVFPSDALATVPETEACCRGRVESIRPHHPAQPEVSPMQSTAPVPDLSGLVTSVRAAQIRGCSSRWIRKLAERGDLPYVEIRLPGAPFTTRLFREEDVRAVNGPEAPVT